MSPSCEVINLISDDDQTPVRRPRPVPATAELEIVRENIIYTHGNKRTSNHEFSIRSPLRTIFHNESSDAQKVKEKDVQVVLERQVLQPMKDYPHARYQCVTHPFGKHDGAHRKRHCNKCYCCVCQIPASECKAWEAHYDLML